MHQDNTNLPQDPNKGKLKKFYNEAITTIERYFPHLKIPSKVCISTVGTLCLKDPFGCPLIVLKGKAASGKTTLLSILGDTGLDIFLDRDEVTAAGFVSMRRYGGEDFLLKMKDKIVIIREGAAMFTGRKDEIRKKIARLTAITNGDGYLAEGGLQGTSGDRGKYRFGILTATTVFDTAVTNAMMEIGPRLLVVEVPEVEKFVTTYQTAKAECKEAIKLLISEVVNQFGLRAVTPKFDERAEELLGRCSKLLTKLRTYLPDDEFEASRGDNESPARIRGLLYDLSAGHAIVQGRDIVLKEDLLVIPPLIVASAPYRRVAVARLLARNTKVDANLVEKACKVSHPTALDALKEVERLGLAVSQKTSHGKLTFTLHPEWQWIGDSEFREFMRKGLSI